MYLPHRQPLENSRGSGTIFSCTTVPHFYSTTRDHHQRFESTSEILDSVNIPIYVYINMPDIHETFETISDSNHIRKSFKNPTMIKGSKPLERCSTPSLGIYSQHAEERETVGPAQGGAPTLLQLASPWILDVHPLILRAKRCTASHTGGGSGAVDDGNPSWFSWMPADKTEGFERYLITSIKDKYHSDEKYCPHLCEFRIFPIQAILMFLNSMKVAKITSEVHFSFTCLITEFAFRQIDPTSKCSNTDQNLIRINDVLSSTNQEPRNLNQASTSAKSNDQPVVSQVTTRTCFPRAKTTNGTKAILLCLPPSSAQVLFVLASVSLKAKACNAFPEIAKEDDRRIVCTEEIVARRIFGDYATGYQNPFNLLIIRTISLFHNYNFMYST
ncbi:hypothetical protein WN51_04921 [Melipona quadrifasciata]|uniref:Uncharacterized protein n=1 Tax=Melipona quadrifasciata TaxID=166423 RepID=A0A0N0BDA4_9HYME|nr:hypothetical protein WN51_04921 [Melipona quadrifasciata]